MQSFFFLPRTLRIAFIGMKFKNQPSRKFFQNKEILLLEDDLLLGKRIAAFLEKSGAEITHCQSIKEAKTGALL